VKLSGALKTAIEAAESETTPTPELKPLAEMLNELQRVDLEFKWDYRRRHAFRRGTKTRPGTTLVGIPGEVFRRAAREYWSREDLVRDNPEVRAWQDSSRIRENRRLRGRTRSIVSYCLPRLIRCANWHLAQCSVRVDGVI
jgi:hypothetical protein